MLVTAKPRGDSDGSIVRYFNDTISTDVSTYTYETSQDSLTIRNLGLFDITLNVGTYLNITINPLTTWENDVSFTEFTIQASGISEIQATAKEYDNKPVFKKDLAGQIPTDILDTINGHTSQLAEKASQVDLNVTDTIAKDAQSKANNPLNLIGSGSIPKEKLVPKSITQNEISDALLQQMTGATPINAVPADGGVTYVKIGIDVPLRKFPFHSLATLKASGTNTTSINELKNAIKKIELYGADEKKQYAVTIVRRNWYYASQTSYNWQITVYEVIGQTPVKAVAEFKTTGTYAEPSGIDVITLATQNATGITGKAWVDWSQLTNGAGYDTMFYSETGLDITTYSNVFDKFTRAKMNSDVISYMYPFQPQANLKSGGTDLTSFTPIKNAIKRVELYGANKTKQYSVLIVRRNWLNSSVYKWQLYIDEVNGSTDVQNVCKFDVTGYVEPTGVDCITLSESNTSGIIAKVWIDWSQLSVGANYYNMRYDESGLETTTYINTNSPTEIMINLPPTIPAIVGKEVNIYFDNIIMCDDLNKYQITVSATVGNQQDERWTFIPSVAGSYTVTINVYKNFIEKIASATTSVVVKAVSVGNAVNKKCLFIGDSTTFAGTYTQELLTLFNSDVMDINLIGTIGTAPNVFEGRGGWTIAQYYSDASSPFVFSGIFDFAQYMSAHSYTNLDYVCFHLGINELSPAFNDSSVLSISATALSQLQSMIDNIHSYNANIKVGIMVTIPPSKHQDAFAIAKPRWLYKRMYHLFVNALINQFKGKEVSKTYLVPININLDTEHNMDFVTVPVNSRNSATVNRQNNAVHPATSGYYQMADIIYYWLKGFES